MRAAFKLGEKLILSARMNMPKDSGASVATSFSSGKLSLTNSRLVFEPDVLSFRTERREISLNDIASVEASQTNLFTLPPVLASLDVTTNDGTKYKFGGALLLVATEKWTKAINSAIADNRSQVPGEQAAANGEPAVYFCGLGGVRIGPLTRKEFDYNRSVGKIDPEAPTWAGVGDWRPAVTFLASTDTPAAADSAPPPPLPPDDRFAWAVVALPIVGSFIALIFGSHFGYLYAFAIIYLCVLDIGILRAGGREAPTTWWWFLITPVYLWKRAKLLNQKPIIFAAFLASATASVFLDEAFSKTGIEASACPLVTQIIQQQLYASASCKSVSIVKDVGDGFYTATATLDNGNDIKITIQNRGKEIYVQIPNQ